MKNFLQPGVALLSVATLAACSGKTASESSSKDAKASSSKSRKIIYFRKQIKQFIKII